MARRPLQPRLPTHASLDPEFARRILEGKTPQPAKAALDFWQARFNALGEKVFDDLEEPTTEALQFVKRVPNVTFATLLKQKAARIPARTDFSERRHITLGHVPANMGGDAG